MTAPTIEIYTTPDCPDCHALKAWLKAQGVPFIEHDLTQPAVADEARRRTGMRVAPLTLIDGQVFYGVFSEQQPRIAALLGLT